MCKWRGNPAPDARRAGVVRNLWFIRHFFHLIFSFLSTPSFASSEQRPARAFVFPAGISCSHSTANGRLSNRVRPSINSPRKRSSPSQSMPTASRSMVRRNSALMLSKLFTRLLASWLLILHLLSEPILLADSLMASALISISTCSPTSNAPVSST